MTSTFSSASEDVIQQTIDIHKPTVTDPDKFYEIPETASQIIENDYKRIALQFPDDLLPDSVPIYKRLKAAIGNGRELFILADTSYGSCCVDEVAAQHANADAIVHYGYACMTKTARLPVIYVFGQSPIDVEDCVKRLSSHEAEGPTYLVHDPDYTWKAKEIASSLGVEQGLPPNSAYTILYIGSNTRFLTNLLITHSQSTVVSYNPTSRTSTLESSQTNRLLMRRYATLQRARDADVFGILVGTLGVADYLPLIKHLRSILAQYHKKSYTISVGKLNPSKLANFLEIECFVLVACPENSIIDAKEFLRPIITPFELEVALSKEPVWDGKYVLDFAQLLESGLGALLVLTVSSAEKAAEPDEDTDQPQFSLVTGSYRHAKRYGPGAVFSPNAAGDGTTDSLILRNQESTIAKMLPDSAAAQFLSERAYRGLDLRLGEDAPSVLEQGRSGIARGYQTDRGAQDPSSNTLRKEGEAPKAEN
ncbi:putative diphthamide synthesis protein-domain-containing protein [Coprinopsis sp. MPI-PUGE-AT-0042]|nr:putative diphthamide synthesis protein-domain-containing protein [Coprinopsis sp. MPI-PUGE-AT-0042]